MKKHSALSTHAPALAITLIAFGLRLWQLDGIPPGWRDDELINSLVISQKFLDGNFAVYFADASGHEALYHALNAIMLGLFSPGVAGIRYLSLFLGTLTVPLTYALGRSLFGKRAGLIAAAALSVSFWSLMYGRIGLRHILTPVLALATFYFFWKGLGIRDWRLGTRDSPNLQSPIPDRRSHNLLFSALFMALGFYTYFAGRGVPLILLAFCGYLWLFARDLFKKRWRHIVMMFGVAGLLAIPLIITLTQQPESEARVAELAVPLTALQDGDVAPLKQHIITTLSMFHSDGDDEWLYNIPHRPIFGSIGTLFFWSGVLLALYYALRLPLSVIRYQLSVINYPSFQQAHNQYAPLSFASAFLLFWWLAGISPAFISIPPASLGHTILAQPAVFLLAALPIWRLGDWGLEIMRSPVGDWKLRKSLISNPQPKVAKSLIAIIFIISMAARDLPDYFQEWPQRGMVRFLYRADYHEIADFLDTRPDLHDFGVTGLLAGPWDKVALSVDLPNEERGKAAPRWYNPERVLLLEPPVSFSGFPKVATEFAEHYTVLVDDEGLGDYQLTRVTSPDGVGDSICFTNGLCAETAVYTPTSGRLAITWQLQKTLDLPAIPLISNPPPPGVYAGARLHVFTQLLDADGNYLAGDDGLWIDPTTLQPGDKFIQQHWLTVPEGMGEVTILFGLYDPKTGVRILTEDGRDKLEIRFQ